MGYKIREMREKLNMTQEELATKSGVTRQTIAALENDPERSTSTKTLLSIAKALGVPLKKIFFE